MSNKSKNGEEEFTQIWIRKSTKVKLMSIKPKKYVQREFVSDFLESAVEHRAELKKAFQAELR